MIDKIKKLSIESLEDVIRIRRHIHKFPELSFQEKETSAYIQTELKNIGIPFTKGHVKTGIIGTWLRVRAAADGKLTYFVR